MRRWTIGIPKVLVVKSIVPLSKFLLLHSAQGPKIQPAPDGRWPPFGDGFFPNSLTATKLFEIQAGSLQKCARTFVVARISKFRKEIPSFEASPVFLYSKSSAYSQLVLDGCLNCGDADARQDLLMTDYQDGSVIAFCSKPLVRRRQESQCLHGWP